MVVVPRLYFPLSLLTSVTSFIGIFNCFIWGGWGGKEKKLNRPSILTLLQMFIYSGSGFKLCVTSKSCKEKVKDDHKEAEKILPYP